MEYISRRIRHLKKMYRRAVRFWRESCSSVRRRKRLIRGVLFLLAAGTMAWARIGRGMIPWVREQISYVKRIEESGPVRAAGQGGMTSVKWGFIIRLDERKIYISQVEEGHEDREAAIGSGSD